MLTMIIANKDNFDNIHDLLFIRCANKFLFLFFYDHNFWLNSNYFPFVLPSERSFVFKKNCDKCSKN